MSIFDKRINYKPFEYAEILDFTEAINKSFWVHSEIDFTADIQDFHSHLEKNEKEAIKKSLLAIAQIEVAVKTFWGNLYQHLPKPEFNGLGSTFAECEFRHSEAYSRLLEVLGYNGEFEKLMETPVIKKRVSYLSDALSSAKSQDRKAYLLSLILFSILIENVSLFSQFAIILSFQRFKGLMKNISNIIAWTSIDEQIHANAGIFIVNKIKEEFPEFFDEEMQGKIKDIVSSSINIEAEILDWIFADGELETINKENLLNFMKYRVDDSLNQIGLPKMYAVTESEYQKMAWFEEEIFANSLDDFFAKRPVDYTKHDKSITADDLF
ncbi:ribonucleotide-diphosphate reductase subunit beta [Chondrinema litorale]|uniref:ribonucleotide-diphosphate reductase subunit beta n=1 Tax=Chondrinema litorale TaxID=2994555 RepID=UPI002542C0CA|nr:ribonucleotide-diphosphate reductase subunit beta [Chondrinema litorale]UZR97418.1 ribonucleotide-diphosphate reductase subunit beta [Chondrinema litorale]